MMRRRRSRKPGLVAAAPPSSLTPAGATHIFRVTVAVNEHRGSDLIAANGYLYTWLLGTFTHLAPRLPSHIVPVYPGRQAQ